VGYDVVGMAYPCGGVNNNEHVAQVIREGTGIAYSRTITSTGSFEPQAELYRFNPTTGIDFDRMMELGQQFVELQPDSPQIFYIWGHSYEMDFEQDRWQRMEDFFRLISGRDDIFYGTNREVLL
jgi:hypothetical protein